MASFDVRGEALSEKQNKFLCDILQKQGFNGNKVIIEVVGKAGDNYSANVKRIIVEKEDGTAFKIIAKVAPTNEIMRKSINVEMTFLNEVIMYKEVLPTFWQLEIDTGVPEEDRFVFPIIYGAYLEELHEIILLEDLFESDFTMPDRFKTLKHDEVTLIVKKFAKLHSLSYLLRTKDPSKYKTFTAKLRDHFASDTMRETFKHIVPVLIESTCNLLDNEKNKNLIRDMLGQYLYEMHKLKEFDMNSEYSVIVHGDAWINNILIKSKDCMLIDYQLSYEKSPVADLHYFINSSTDHMTRYKHYHEWIDSYHEELSKRLVQFGLQVNYVYPKDKLREDLKRYANFAFASGLLLANVINMNLDDAARLKDTMNTVDVKELLNLFKPEDMESSTLVSVKLTVEGLINTFKFLGYIN